MAKRRTKRVTSFPYTTDPDAIPTKKIVKITPEPGEPVRVIYECPRAVWQEHLETWGQLHRGGRKDCPEPGIEGHLMFKHPTDYGCIPYGCEDPALKRKAYRAHVEGLLRGWDRDLTKEERNKLIEACVDAMMEGRPLGAAPFFACIAGATR